jgi:hypothetical protein
MNYEDLNPGIRETVRLLRDNGFATCDSGDGVTREFECDIGIPYVHMTIPDKSQLIAEADRLAELLTSRGIRLEPLDEDGGKAYIQADYSPGDGICAISVFGVTDSMLEAS